MKSKIDKELMFKKYYENKSFCQIAREMGFDDSHIRKTIQKCIANGEITERKLEKIPRVRKPREKPLPKPEPKPREFVKPKIVREYPPTYDYPVKCDKKCSIQCIYGCQSSATMGNEYGCKCNYLLCTNHSRGCPPDQCTKFVQVDKDHEKLLPKLFRSAINGDKKL